MILEQNSFHALNVVSEVINKDPKAQQFLLNSKQFYLYR